MRTVITYGTFDLFHKGHYNILKRAKEEGDYLIVGVTGESYDAERGKLSVQDSLATRIENVKATGFADKIIVEEYLGQKIPDILKYHVDVLVIGSDWKGKFDHLKKYCEIKYLERTKDISSTQLREEKLTIYKLGIVTDDINDKEVVSESPRVSGIHVESVFSENRETADAFCEKYELYKGFDDYDDFLDSIDIVYIKSNFSSRLNYIERALKKAKHVICEVPYTIELEKEKYIKKLAQENGVVFFEDVPMLHLGVFGQLLWMARGNVIGDIVSVKCSVSKKMFDEDNHIPFIDMAYVPICAIMKIAGYNYTDSHVSIVKKENGDIRYGLLTFEYENAIATAEVSEDVDIECGMTIYGTTGEIKIPDDWWRVGYFSILDYHDSKLKHYSSNFEGNGFRYLIQSILREIRSSDNLEIAGRIRYCLKYQIIDDYVKTGKTS